MVKLLEKACCDVEYNPNQTCCGQPAFNAGYIDEARAVCSKFLKDFDSTDYVVAPSASCVGFVRNYFPKIFDNAAVHNQVKDLGGKLFELSEFLTEVLHIEQFGAKLKGRAVYHDSCAALRECKIKEGPRKLLGHVRGLELVEMPDTESCCGFGGTFAVKFEAISVAMADQKIQQALALEADYIISTDSSCLMHLDACIRQQQLPIKTMHLADVLANGWE